MQSLRLCLSSALALALGGCSFFSGLDQIHQNEPAWDIHLTWDRTEHIETEDPANPGFDKDGNKIPKPETAALFNFPPITAGLGVTVESPVKVTPTVGVALVDLKAPYVRWMDVQAFGGYQQLGVGLYKRWTSIVEICTGVGVVRDFDQRRWLPMIGVTITKF